MAATADAPAKTKTPYLIFRLVDEGLWQPVSDKAVEAISDTKAIQTYVAAASGDATGTYLAIPQRSYRPRQVAVETNPRVRIS